MCTVSILKLVDDIGSWVGRRNKNVKCTRFYLSDNVWLTPLHILDPTATLDFLLILSLRDQMSHKQNNMFGWEPWSRGYGRQLIFERSWVRILVLYTRWTFSHLFVETKRGRGWPIFEKQTCFSCAQKAKQVFLSKIFPHLRCDFGQTNQS